MAGVAVGAGVHHVAADAKLFAVSYIEVYAEGLGSGDTVLTTKTTEARGSAIGETQVVHIVQSTDKGDLVAIPKAVDIERAVVAVVGAISSLDITKPPVLHAFFHREVDDGFVFTIIHTGKASKVALAVYYLETFNHIHRQVARCHGRVIAKKLFAINEDFGNFLTVDGDFTVATYFGAGKAANEVFNYGIRRGAISGCIVLDSVFLHRNRGANTHDLGFAQHYRIFMQSNGAKSNVALTKVHIAECGIIPHIRCLYNVSTTVQVLKLEIAVDVGHHAIYSRAVACRKQTHRRTGKWLTLRVNHSSGDGVCRRNRC